MAARRGTATKSKRKASGKSAGKRSVSSARANKLAAFGFTGFLVLMAGAAAIALDLPAKAAFSAGEAVGSAGFRVDGYQIVGLKQMDRKLVDAVVTEAGELRESRVGNRPRDHHCGRVRAACVGPATDDERGHVYV